MRTFLALCTMIFLWCTANLNAAPSDNDAGQSAIQISVAYLQPVAILYDAPDLQTADLSPDIGFFKTSNSNQNSTMDVSGRHATKPNVANNYDGNYKDGDFWDVTQIGRQQRVNSDQIFVLPQATKDGNEGGNSANSTALWTATDHDDGAISQFFFLSNTTASTTSAQPDFDFIC